MVYHMFIEAICFRPGIFNFPRTTVNPLWTLSRNKNLIYYLLFIYSFTIFYLRKGSKVPLMILEIFRQNILFLRHFLGLYKKVLICNIEPPFDAIP